MIARVWVKSRTKWHNYSRAFFGTYDFWLRSSFSNMKNFVSRIISTLCPLAPVTWTIACTGCTISSCTTDQGIWQARSENISEDLPIANHLNRGMALCPEKSNWYMRMLDEKLRVCAYHKVFQIVILPEQTWWANQAVPSIQLWKADLYSHSAYRECQFLSVR